MKDKTQITNILKAELILLAKEIIKDIHEKDLKDIYKSSRKLYEKTNAVYQLSKLMEAEDLDALFLGDRADKKEEPSPAKPSFHEEKNPIKKEEKIQVEEKEKNKSTEENKEVASSIYKSVNNMKFVPKAQNREEKTEAAGEIKKMNIGLNDKIAFIRHLFDNDSTTYNKVIDTLNTIDSYEEALTYLNKEVKPKFNDWKDKDEYEFRLIQLLELKFN